MCIINYFYKDIKKDFKIKPEFYIQERKKRSFIKNSLKLKFFKVGDIIEFIFFLKNMALIFSGICIAIKRKYFIKADVSLVLRNIIMKVSMHALAMGVVATFILTLASKEGVSSGIYITITLLIAGLVCTSRLIASDHTTKEVYTGLFAGVICQLLGTWLG